MCVQSSWLRTLLGLREEMGLCAAGAGGLVDGSRACEGEAESLGKVFRIHGWPVTGHRQIDTLFAPTEEPAPGNAMICSEVVFAPAKLGK